MVTECIANSVLKNLLSKNKMIPKLLVGAPGTGKTASVRAEYEHAEVLLLSSCTEEDIAGIPYREGSSERRTTPPFIERIKEAAKNKKTCLFLDELDKARREVADTLLTLITHPQEFGIPEGVDIIAAANPPEWGGGDGISQPMLTRFAVIEYNPDVAKWCDLARMKFSHLSFIETFVEKVSVGEIPLLESVGEGLDFRLTCPRTWFLALEAVSQGQDDLIKGLLTPNSASSLIAFLSQSRDRLDTVHQISRDIGTTKVTKEILRIKI